MRGGRARTLVCVCVCDLNRCVPPRIKSAVFPTSKALTFTYDWLLDGPWLQKNKTPVKACVHDARPAARITGANGSGGKVGCSPVFAWPSSSFNPLLP